MLQQRRNFTIGRKSLGSVRKTPRSVFISIVVFILFLQFEIYHRNGVTKVIDTKLLRDKGHAAVEVDLNRDAKIETNDNENNSYDAKDDADDETHDIVIELKTKGKEMIPPTNENITFVLHANITFVLHANNGEKEEENRPALFPGKQNSVMTNEIDLVKDDTENTVIELKDEKHEVHATAITNEKTVIVSDATDVEKVEESHSVLISKKDSVMVKKGDFNKNEDQTTKSTLFLQSNDTVKEYEKALNETLKGSPDVKTAFQSRLLYGGLNNQIMKFIGVMYLAANEDFGQIVEESIEWKDLYGHNTYEYHHMFWDVVHWNSYYPKLPRIVRYDKEQHPHLKAFDQVLTIEGKNYTKTKLSYNVDWDVWKNRSITEPQPIVQNGHQSDNRMKELQKAIDHGSKLNAEKQNNFEMLQEILKGALRPHPFLQQIVDNFAAKLREGEDGSYMVLHARVEPDMGRQNEHVCHDRRLYNITEIINQIYEKYPEPPVKTVLIQFSRSMMEEEANPEFLVKHPKLKEERFHILNHHNLKIINQLVKEGMWNGKVKVVEAGSRTVEEAGDPYYKWFSNLAGGIVNLFLAIQSDIMIGSEISTYSVQVINSRFYRGLKENYFYHPDGGLRWMTPPNRSKQFRFEC